VRQRYVFQYFAHVKKLTRVAVLQVCGGGGQGTLYAWAKNAPSTVTPADVAFRMDPNGGERFLVLQVHYAHPLQDSDHAGVELKFQTTP
jgi:hypothetical protein